MQLSSLTAISSVDGRYAAHTTKLREIFSEYGLIRYRLIVEIRWFQALAANPGIPQISGLSEKAKSFLEGIINDFGLEAAQRVKAYAKHMAGITPDLDGLAKLERSVDRLQTLFDSQLRPQEPCRRCPHLQGF